MGCGGLSSVDEEGAKDRCQHGPQDNCGEGFTCMLSAEQRIYTCVSTPKADCLVGDNAPCQEWQTCVGKDGDTPGAPGTCQDECRVGSVDCGKGYECVSPGRCQKEETPVGRLCGDNECRSDQVCLENQCVTWTPSSRLECSHTLTSQSTVTEPLVVSGRRLVFGASTQLHVFDTATCRPIGQMQTGRVQGPMVALGDSGRVAVAIGTGGLGYRNNRLSLVNVAGGTPSFVYNISDGRDCAQNSLQTLNNANFNQGLSLLTRGNASGTEDWAFAAPANNNNRLVAYRPYRADHRCVTSDPVPHPFIVPIAQDLYSRVVGISRDSNPPNSVSIQWGGFPANTGVWDAFTNPDTIAIQNPTFMAIVDQNRMWVSDSSIGSPAAVDSEDLVYVVERVENTPGDYQLNSYHINIGPSLVLTGADRTLGPQSDPFTVPAPAGGGIDIVGSPLLGEPIPGNLAEVYVVTMDGQVLAFRADTLALLWREELNIHISRSAQPVLLGSTLWVVGEGGQIRGIRTNSRGLKRDADWPKAFRDNCNTSSRVEPSANMPGCY